MAVVVVAVLSSPTLWCGCGGGNSFIPPRGVAVVVVMISSPPCGVAVVVVLVSSPPLWCCCGGGNGFIPPCGVAVVVVMVSSTPVVLLWWW